MKDEDRNNIITLDREYHQMPKGAIYLSLNLYKQASGWVKGSVKIKTVVITQFYTWSFLQNRSLRDPLATLAQSIARVPSGVFWGVS